MFTTNSIIDNLDVSVGLDYKKLCRSLKITKKSDKNKLDIALTALEKLEIINKNEKNEYTSTKDSNHIVAKIRCSSKAITFATTPYFGDNMITIFCADIFIICIFINYFKTF